MKDDIKVVAIAVGIVFVLAILWPWVMVIFGRYICWVFEKFPL